MKFAAKIRAEQGWKVALANANGGINFVDIEQWGLIMTDNGIDLVPLDHIKEFDVRERKNFLMIIDPNKELDISDLKIRAIAKAKELYEV